MKKIISTNEAPAAIGPYSQALRSGGFLFCSGQIPLDPKSGQVVSGDIAAQTRRVLDNIAAVLRAEGLTFDSVIKTTIFLTDLGDFQTVNEIYGSYFKQDPPARSTVQSESERLHFHRHAGRFEEQEFRRRKTRQRQKQTSI